MIRENFKFSQGSLRNDSENKASNFLIFVMGLLPNTQVVYIFFTNKIKQFFTPIVQVFIKSPHKFKYCKKDVKPGMGSF